MSSAKLASSKIFTPLKIGNLTLKHRVILAPLTRGRSPEHIPTEVVKEYYEQRATPGGLLISEAAHISVMSGNYTDIPGIYTPEQVRAWRAVTDAVHAKGGYIYCQLWHVGRTTHPTLTGGRKPVSSSAKIWEGGKVAFTPGGMVDTVEPREMTVQDIKDTISDYVHAAKCAVEAGFDGVEIHSANGYLLDQFICDNINSRTDAYGGNTANRARLVLEVVDAVASAIGSHRIGIRLSPFSYFQGTEPSDIIGQYGYIIEKLASKKLAFVHLLEPRMDLMGSEDAKIARLHAMARHRGVPESEIPNIISLKPFRKILADAGSTTALLANGGYNDKNATEPVEGGLIDAVAYGRLFISNPDLVERLRNGWPLAKYDRSTFYMGGTKGYTDYPTYEEEQKAAGSAEKL